jgi:hypothetical protein
VEDLNEIVHLMVGNAMNQLVIADDHLALQFGEHLYDQDLPNFDDMLAAVCVSRGGKAPWLLSLPRFAAQVALQGEYRARGSGRHTPKSTDRRSR